METDILKNYGFVEPKIDNTHFVLGGIFSLPKVVVKPDGQWDDALPQYEAQYNELFDTYNCTSYGTLNAIEMLEKAKYNEDANYSERALGIASHTKPPGNDPQVVCDTVRKVGIVPDSELPLDKATSIETYYTPDPLTQNVLDKCLTWLKTFSFGHEWLWTGNKPMVEQQNRMMEALRYSPLGVAVNAWTRNDRSLYVRNGADNHWCVIFGYAQGNHWKCFDSYDGGVKLLDWDYGFTWVKRFHLEKLNKVEEKKGIIEQLIYWLKQLLIMTPEETPTVPEPPKEEPKAPLYDWSTPEKARHSARVVMDTFNLTWAEKDLLCAVIMAESGFNPKAINHNKNGSTDYGLCQMNNAYWIGKGRYFDTPEEVFNFPEKSVEFMVNAYKSGKLNWWVAYKSGAYKKYL